MSNYVDKRKMQFWSGSSIMCNRVNYIQNEDSNEMCGCFEKNKFS